MKILDFILKHKDMALITLIALLCFMSFFLGRSSVHSNITETTQTKIDEHSTTKVVDTSKSTDSKDTYSNENLHIHKERVEVTDKDGNKTVKETTDTDAAKTVHEVEIKYVDRTVTVEKEVEKRVEVVKELKIETKKPDWHISLRAGTDFTQIKPSLTAPYFDPLLVGVTAERRIIGPVFAGIWGQSDTRFNNVSGGIVIGAEF